jgi:hypothetical protein
MKKLSLVTLSLLVILSTACSKSVRLDGNQSGTTDLSAGVSGGGSGGNTSPSPTPSSSVSPSPSPSTTATPVACSGGQVAIGASCVCPGTDGWDGKNCISCADNQLWNATTQTCDNTCKSGMVAKSDGTCTSCASGEAWDGTQCVSSTGPTGGTAEVCDSFQELKSPFVIPARDCSHTCYYVKLSSAVASQPSDDFTVFEQSVTARDHNDYSDLNPKSPHIIGSSTSSSGAVGEVQFVLEGQRQVMLASDTAGTQDVAVDNFILFKTTMGCSTSYFGEGTSDSFTYSNASIAGDDGYVNVNGAPLKNFLVGASGGTASFAPVDYSSTFRLNTVVDFKSEALDCGQVGQVSDIYLLFR